MENNIFVYANNSKGYDEVDLETLDKLANIVMMLNPLSDKFDDFSYSSVLEQYMSTASNLREKITYMQICSNQSVRELFEYTLYILYLEKIARKNGIDQDHMLKYNKMLSKYKEYSEKSKRIEETIEENDESKRTR